MLTEIYIYICKFLMCESGDLTKGHISPNEMLLRAGSISE
jgi:hypothetical protein